MRQAAVFEAHAILEPADRDRPYLVLYELRQRALMPENLIFTFRLDVLHGQSDAFTMMFRFHGCLQRKYKSSDGTLLYSSSEDKLELYSQSITL